MNRIKEVLEENKLTQVQLSELIGKSFEVFIQSNTKLIYIDTSSNPLMKLVDIFAIAKLAKAHQIITVADNTFASPIIQNPIDLGIDIVIHSATKYFGGHSDISAGAVASTQEIMDKIWDLAKDFGGNLSDYTVWLLERSMKTLGIRVKAQQRNAKRLAKFLEKNKAVKAVHYPGLKSSEYHSLAKIQMKGYGAMLSFELKDPWKSEVFLKALKLIKRIIKAIEVKLTLRFRSVFYRVGSHQYGLTLSSGVIQLRL